MTVETATYINGLTTTNPPSGDQFAEGDDHLRLIKSVLKATFPNATKAFRFPTASAKTGAYTVQSTDDRAILTGDASSAAFSFTLPSLGSSDAGWSAVFVKIDSGTNTVTVAPASGTISGQASFKLNTQWAFLEVLWTGAAWIASVWSENGVKRVVTKTADATLTVDELDEVVLVTPASAVATITLPTASGYAGYKTTIKRTSASYNVIIDGDGSETIDGETSIYLYEDDEFVTLISDGTNWHIIASNRSGKPGSVIAWPTATVPDGYLECDGSAVSRTTYARLFGVISDDYGSGDGSTTFNLPDYRGEFLRGYDNGEGNDPDAASRTDRGDSTTGDAVGTKQADELEAHVHTYTRPNGGFQPGTTASNPAWPYAISTGVDTGSTGGNETRPRNVSVMYCIKV